MVNNLVFSQQYSLANHNLCSIWFQGFLLMLPNLYSYGLFANQYQNPFWYFILSLYIIYYPKRLSIVQLLFFS